MRNKAFVIAVCAVMALPGYAQRAFSKGDKWGYKDESGKVIVQPIYEQAKDFSEGLGNVKRMGWWGYVNKFGKSIIPFSFDESYPHHDGLAGARKDYYWGFIDRLGNTVIPFEYSLVKNFSEGLAAVKKDGRWGYIDKQGTVIIPLEYDDAGEFRQGLAAVKFGGKWGYIDTYGMRAIDVQYDEAQEFGNGYAAVRRGNSWGYIDLNGEQALDFVYEGATRFCDGVAVVTKDGRNSVIDMYGTYYKNIKDAKKNSPGVKEVTRTAVSRKVDNRRTYADTATPVVNVGDSFYAFAKNYVENKIVAWQKKDEFEKTSDYQKRVNETTYKAKIKELTNEAKDLYIKKHSSGIIVSGVLGDYDADNEVFIVRERHFGNLLVKVPYEEAKEFKSAWAQVSTTPTYGVANDRLTLEKVVFSLPSGKNYTYSNDEALEFSHVEIEGDFGSVDIESQGNGPVAKQEIGYTSVSVGKSDVDMDIPQCDVSNSNTFAVIIANEVYQTEAPVEYALNDGEIFAEYCNKVLGLPKDNIMIKKNATLNNIRSAVSWLKMVTEAYKGEASVIFYYAGHGVPDETTKQAYLLPIDGESINVVTAYSLTDLYNTLGSFNVKNTMVFLDACFSGAQRGEKMLASARATVVKPRECEPKGKTVVFAATHGEQTAMPYREKSHGMFTYFLLKKLKETKGNIELGALSEYVSEEVNKIAVLKIKKNQTPTVIPSLSMASDWSTLKMIKK